MLVVGLLFQAACERQADPTAPGSHQRSADILDGAHGAGNAHFYFLPPMAKQPRFTGDFDGTLAPVVEICAWATNACTLPLVSRFTRTSGSGSEILRVNADDQHYQVNWHTRDLNLDPAKIYRVRVLVDAIELGHADVVAVRKGGDAKQVDATRFVAIVAGQTLPIKFRIEQGAMPSGIGPAGGVFEAFGGDIRLSFPPGAVSSSLAVTVTAVATVPQFSGYSVVGGSAYDFGPDGTHFNKPVQLTIKYDPANIPAGVSESSLRLFRLVSGGWQPVFGSMVNTATHTVTGSIVGFSTYAVVSFNGSVLTLGGVGIANVDGTLSPGEWDDAATVLFSVNLPGGGTALATLLVMNDGLNLNVAVKIQRSSLDAVTRVQLSFDNNDDNLVQHGDERLAVTAQPAGGLFQDGYWQIGGSCPVGFACEALDVDAGGSVDGSAQVGNDGAQTVIEFAHQLNTADNLHDFSLGLGSTSALFIAITLIDASGNVANTLFPAFTRVLIMSMAGAVTSSISAGRHATCAVTTAGLGNCWGVNIYGGLGDGTNDIRRTPAPVLGGRLFKSISAGSAAGLTGAHACGIEGSGAAFCWGLGTSGQLGDGNQNNSNEPMLVTGGFTYTEVSAGRGYTCGVTTSNQALCWGAAVGGLGDGSTTVFSSAFPTLVYGGHSWATIRAGVGHTCAVTTSGILYCWGQNNFGQLGLGHRTLTRDPTFVMTGVSSVAVGTTHTCALNTVGNVSCWGANPFGEFGNGTNGTVSDTAVAVMGVLTFKSIDAGFSDNQSGGYTCGVTTSGAAYCWGSNDAGQLGDGSFTPKNVPVPVSGGLTFRLLSAGDRHTCGITTDGDAYCWGLNDYSQRGDNTVGGINGPVLVGGGNAYRVRSPVRGQSPLRR